MPDAPSVEPVRELHAMPFWPALILVATPEDGAAITAVLARARRWRPSLPAPRVEVCRMPGVVTPGRPRMYARLDEVPTRWLGSSALPPGVDR